MVITNKAIPSSFRDPSGFMFYRNGLAYRQLNLSGKDDYDFFIESGLYESLVNAELLVPHEEICTDIMENDGLYKIIKPKQIPFISYPYEWCFSQFKRAALTTLQIQKMALEFGMSLKDCSAYNIQYAQGKAMFIDTLSFEKYHEGQPWVGYRQFCQHFFAPLVLMSCTDIRLSQLLRVYIDGIPLDLTSRLLPFRTFIAPSILFHIRLHAKSQSYFADKADKTVKRGNFKMGLLALRGLRGLLDNLESAVSILKWSPPRTVWADYYQDNNYSSDALSHKKRIVSEFLDTLNPKTVWDLGANTGMFSRIASEKGIQTVAFDFDAAAAEINYCECMRNEEPNLLPLLLDLTNPSPGIGWENRERMSLVERGPADTVLALALIHHLAIFNNLPFSKIAHFFKTICKSLIIEFVPKSDSQVQRLLLVRKDIFVDYTQKAFEEEFGKYFSILKYVKIQDSDRIMYLMQRDES